VTSDPCFHDHDIFEVEYLKNGASKGQCYYSALTGNYIPNIWSCTMFGDLH